MATAKPAVAVTTTAKANLNTPMVMVVVVTDSDSNNGSSMADASWATNNHDGSPMDTMAPARSNPQATSAVAAGHSHGHSHHVAEHHTRHKRTANAHTSSWGRILVAIAVVRVLVGVFDDHGRRCDCAWLRSRLHQRLAIGSIHWLTVSTEHRDHLGNWWLLTRLNQLWLLRILWLHLLRLHWRLHLLVLHLLRLHHGLTVLVIHGLAILIVDWDHGRLLLRVLDGHSILIILGRRHLHRLSIRVKHGWSHLRGRQVRRRRKHLRWWRELLSCLLAPLLLDGVVLLLPLVVLLPHFS